MEDQDLPPFVLAERDALLAEIHEAFPGGSRQGGVSWSEADVIDDYGSPDQRAAARARDRDTRWQDLVDDPNWNPSDGGHWSFLDAIGFRYYLPAAMVLAVRQGYDAGILFHLTLPEGDLRDYKAVAVDVAQPAPASLHQALPPVHGDRRRLRRGASS